MKLRISKIWIPDNKSAVHLIDLMETRYPITVCRIPFPWNLFGKSYMVIGGYHRLWAAIEAGLFEVEVTVLERTYEMVPLDKILIHPRMSKHTQQYQNLLANIKEKGILEPVALIQTHWLYALVFGKPYYLASGTFRYMAAEELGYKEIPAYIYR